MQSYIISLGTDVGTRAQNYIKSLLLGQINEMLYISYSPPIVNIFMAIMQRPFNVTFEKNIKDSHISYLFIKFSNSRINDIQTSCSHSAQSFRPSFGQSTEIMK